jgi:hypothetical protein
VAGDGAGRIVALAQQPGRLGHAPSAEIFQRRLADHRLKKIFPPGVCNWSKRGLGFRGVVPNASFGPSEVNLVFDVTNPDSGAEDDED